MQRSARAVLCAALAAAACSSPATTEPYPPIDQAAIRAHLERIEEAEDHGVGAGSEGERMAADYIAGVFNGMGLRVERQSVPLVRIRPRTGELRFTGDATHVLRPGHDFVAWTRRNEPVTSIGGDVVFVGFGISAPRQGWDDYKNVDVAGKIVLMLGGDPRSGERPQLGPIGRDVYGRRTYKFEEAARRGAAGAFVIHLPDRTQPWEVIARSATEVQELAVPRGGPAPMQVEGWITEAAARSLLPNAGRSFEDVRELADQSNFEAMTLPLRLSLEIASEVTPATATNIVAVLDPEDDGKGKRQEEPYVLISTHWNDLPDPGATLGRLAQHQPGNEPPGVSVVLETARALVEERPRRPAIFLVVTAESDGMFGLEYYLENPVRPLARTRAAIHMAGFSTNPDDRDLRFVGTGYQALKGLVREAAAEQFRGAWNDTEPQRLDFYRAASASYTAHAIPSVFMTSRLYPRPDGGTDMAIAALDARMLFHLARRVSESGYWPAWTPVHEPPVPGAPPPARRGFR